jgi:hypothetical protein
MCSAMSNRKYAPYALLLSHEPLTQGGINPADSLLAKGRGGINPALPMALFSVLTRNME